MVGDLLVRKKEDGFGGQVRSRSTVPTAGMRQMQTDFNKLMTKLTKLGLNMIPVRITLTENEKNLFGKKEEL